MSCLAAWCAKPSGNPTSAHPQTLGKAEEREPLSCRFFYSEVPSVGEASPTGDIKPPLQELPLFL